MKVSVIDLGFNSLKLVSYEVRDDASFCMFEHKSVPARHGERLSQTGFLAPTPMRRAIDGLKIFKELNEYNAVKQSLAVTTSAVREAANAKQFLDNVSSETGFKFRVLSGKEEALYSFTGAARSLRHSEILFFDIGGGSVEFVYSRDRKIRKILSLPLGGLRLTQMYGESDSMFRGKAWDKMEKRILDLLPSKKELSLTKNATLVGVGGNLRALARWDQEIKEYPFDKLHNYVIKRDSVEFMTEELSNLSAKEISDIDVIGGERAKTMAAGSLVIKLIMSKLGLQKLTVSTHGLRDGVLTSFLDDPLAYHRGNMAKTIRKTLKARIATDQIPVAKRFLDTIETFDLISDREREILFYELSWLVKQPLWLKPNELFHMMMEQDSFLLHKEQLIAAISAVESRRARSADWLYSRYKSLLKGKDSKDEVKKLTAISRFLELILRTGSTVKLNVPTTDRGSKIKLRISSGGEYFPETILQSSVRELSDELDRFVEYSLNYDSPKKEDLALARNEVLKQ